MQTADWQEDCIFDSGHSHSSPDRGFCKFCTLISDAIIYNRLGDPSAANVQITFKYERKCDE